MNKRYDFETIQKVLEDAKKTTVAKACEKHGVAEATYYLWKRKYSGAEPADELSKRGLIEENNFLKRRLGEALVELETLKRGR